MHIYSKKNFWTICTFNENCRIYKVDISKGEGQHFERRNVERLKFRNYKVANIKITKELFHSFIIEFIFSFFRYYLNTQNI